MRANRSRNRSRPEIQIDIEYRRWKEVYKPIYDKIKSLRLNRRQTYEIKNILERFSLRMANEPPFTEIYLDLDLDHDIYKNLLREMGEKGILGERSRKTFARFIQSQIHYHLENVSKQDLKNVSVRRRGNIFHYRDFRYCLNDQRANTESFKSATDEQIMKMVLRYSILFLGGQQWNLPQDWYRNTAEKFDVSVEGFASPLNSQLMLFRDSPKFCSVFRDTDKPFGSLCNIFKLRPHLIKDKVMMNNPPYILELMNLLMETQTQWLDATPVRIIMCVAAWEDAEYYQNAMSSKYLKYQERLKPNKHYYEKTERGKLTKIIARFPSHIFVFSSHKKEAPKMQKLYKTITDGWKIK